MRKPAGYFLAAAVLAALMCLFPARTQEQLPAQQPSEAQATAAPGIPAGADLSERTHQGTYLHRTLFYAPCGHSIQRRGALPAELTGLTRSALEERLGSVMDNAAVTGFSAAEVDVACRLDIPCPMHWVLRSGEDSLLHVLQNRTGETLENVRDTDVPLERVPQEERSAVVSGRVFDDVQALEGYLESLSS